MPLYLSYPVLFAASNDIINENLIEHFLNKVQAAINGIFFNLFMSIFWLRWSLIPSLTFSNELISCDEGMHTDFMYLLFSHLKHCAHPDTDTVKIEQEFFADTLPCGLIGMNATLMCQYIKFVTHCLLISLNNNKVYIITNPFDFMDMVLLQGKTNFFEKQVLQTT